MTPRTVCAKKDIEGLQTCELKVGHRGEHQAEWQGEIITWGRDAKTTRRVRQVSDKQELRNAFLAGVKAAWFAMQLERDGRFSCDDLNCSVSFSRGEWHTAWLGLDLHHRRPRSEGHGYRGGMDFGTDNPVNLRLLCRAHHKLEHSQVQWSNAS